MYEHTSKFAGIDRGPSGSATCGRKGCEQELRFQVSQTSAQPGSVRRSNTNISFDTPSTYFWSLFRLCTLPLPYPKPYSILSTTPAVNSLAFHRYGTFATAGSDGAYTFWDKDSKQRLKHFHRNPNPISAASFNRDGTIYAYAVSYDWSKGHEYYDKSKPNKIYLHAVNDSEIKQR